MFSVRKGTTVALVVLAAAVAPPARAGAAPACFGKPATVHEPAKHWLRGTSGDDVIVVTEANWTVHALGGDDRICKAKAELSTEIYGGPGRDRIASSSPFDDLDGGPGDDVIVAKAPSSLSGGNSDDVLRGGTGQAGGPGDDVMVALRGIPGTTYFGPGAGDDVVDSTHGPGAVSYLGAPRGVLVRLPQSSARGWGRDTLLHVEDVTGTKHDDVLVGTDEVYKFLGDRRSNWLEGSTGNDLVVGRGGPDHLEGGNGVDVVSGGDGNDNVNSHSTDGFDVPGDRLSGGPGNDRLSGGNGPDVLTGGPGNDDLTGQYGHNSLSGGGGADLLVFGGHIETLDGGPGVDTADFGVFGPVHADLREQEARLGNFTLEMESIESLWGSYFGDTLIGDDGDNLLFDGGNYSADGQEDILVGGRGNDVVALWGDITSDAENESFRAEGGDGEDTLTFSVARSGTTVDLAAGTATAGDSPGTVAGFEVLVGSRENDSLTGDDGTNFISGGAGDDMLHGRGGDDVLVGEDGDDTADGGDGNDGCDAEHVVSCEGAPPAARSMRSLLGLLSRLPRP